MILVTALVSLLFDPLGKHQYENSDQFQYADGLEKVQAVQVEA